MATATKKKAPAKKTTTKTTARTSKKTVAKRTPTKSVARKTPATKKTVSKKVTSKVSQEVVTEVSRGMQILRVVLAIIANSLFSATLVNGSVNPLAGLKYFEVYSQLEAFEKTMLIFIPVYFFQILAWHYLTVMKWSFWERATVVVAASAGAFIGVHNILPLIFS